MNASFHTGNRKRLYEAMKPASLLVMFSGEDVRKTNDEYYPFYTDRDFYYLTGLDQHELVLMAVKEPSGNVHEQIYILPPDLMAERWTGARLKPAEVEALSGISDVRFVNQFQTDFHALAAGGHYSLTSGQIAQVYLDLFRVSPQDIDRPGASAAEADSGELPLSASRERERHPAPSAAHQAALRNRRHPPSGKGDGRGHHGDDEGEPSGDVRIPVQGGI